MKSTPQLTAVQLKAFLQATYGLVDIRISLSGGGEDTWGYRVSDPTQSKDYHLKVYPKTRPYHWEAIARVPRLLAGQGIRAVGPVDEQIPICDGYHLLLYPLIDGLSAVEKPFNPAQLTELGRTLARVHAATEIITEQVDCPREAFDTSDYARDCRRVLGGLPQAEHSDDVYRRELAQLLLPLQARLQQELDDFVVYGQRARAEAVAYVLCHADPSIGNVIANGDAVYLIDWDGVIIAPKERDLMHFGADDQPSSAPVYVGYAEVAGAFDLNQTVLRYYGLHWNIQEIIDYGARLLFEDAPEEQKVHDLHEMQVFLDYSGLA